MLLLRDYAIQQQNELPRCEMHIQHYVGPEQVFSVVAVNRMGAELFSEYLSLCALSEKLHPCIMWGAQHA